MLLMSGLIAVTSCSTVRSGTTSSEFCSVLLGTGGVSQGVSCVLVLTCSGSRAVRLAVGPSGRIFSIHSQCVFSIRSGLAGLRRFWEQRSYHSFLGDSFRKRFPALLNGYTCRSDAVEICCRNRNTRTAGFGVSSYFRRSCPDAGDKGRGPDHGLSAGP